jgi:hypothetical protein
MSQISHIYRIFWDIFDPIGQLMKYEISNISFGRKHVLMRLNLFG